MVRQMHDDWPHFFRHSKSNFHALGVIAAVFNLLEHRLLGLLLLYVGVDNVTSFLFQKLANPARIELLTKAVSLKAETPEIKGAVLHFAAGFEACTEIEIS
jgi:hypothetical protein